MRISIIGHCSSGKSTLAKRISEKLKIPHLHIDRLWFKSGTYKLLKPKDSEELEKARAYMKAKVEDFIKQKSWVSDGWYSRLQPMITDEADQLIFLDIPLWRRLRNHLSRIFLSERHKELNMWDDIKFILEIIARTFNRGPKIQKFVEENRGKLLVLKSHKEADQYLANLR